MKASLSLLETPEDSQHLKGRLEAFSDIVFGFSLAQLAGTLKVPAARADWLAAIPDFLLLGLTFILICSIWWSHYRLFRAFFVVSRIGILLNFLLLAAVLFLTYPLHAILQIGVGAFYQGVFVWIVYFINMAVIFGLLSLLHGWQLRRGSGLSPTHWQACAVHTLTTTTLMGTFLLAIVCVQKRCNSYISSVSYSIFHTSFCCGFPSRCDVSALGKS